MTVDPQIPKPRFRPGATLKRDIFSETRTGTTDHQPDRPVVQRRLDHVPQYARPLARWLLRKEIRGLTAAHAIAGCPELIHADETSLLRHWIKGTPLHLARPADPAWYRDAKRLLRDMRRAGVTHNDAAKPQNWLMTPRGKAALIDFQLSHVHRRRGRLFRLMAREDLRHLLKHKRAFAPQLLTPSETRMLARKSPPARIWMATGKPLYNFVTRRLLRWSDGEGTPIPPDQCARTARQVWQADPRIRDMAFCSYPRAAQTEGLYAFVETRLDAAFLKQMVPGAKPDLIQPVSRLPRRSDGTVRLDVLTLIAGNQLEALHHLIIQEPVLSGDIQPLIDNRQNLTDRVFR